MIIYFTLYGVRTRRRLLLQHTRLENHGTKSFNAQVQLRNAKIKSPTILYVVLTSQWYGQH